MTAQSNPNSLVKTAVANAFERLLRAGELPAVQFKWRPSGNCSFDNTEYNKHWAAYMQAVDRELKKNGFQHGIHQKTTAAIYATAVSRAVRTVTAADIIKGTQRLQLVPA